MRTIVVGSIAAAILLAVAGCASPGADAPAAPGSPSSLADLPTPSPAGEVLAIATVLEQDDGAILCVGAVAESAPPQCDGPALLDWDWDAFEHQETGGVRWVQGVALTGVYEAAADAFTQTSEPMSAAAITLPAIEIPTGDVDEATIARVQADLLALDRDDVLGFGGGDGIVVLDVLYDDGSMQAALDEAYGTGAVFVVSTLRETGDASGEPPIMEPPLETAAPVITDADVPDWLAELPRPSTAEPVTAVGTVLESDSGARAGMPMLCMNVATSYPPQCGGPEIIGWDWEAVAHEEASGVRWADSVAMRVTVDGPSFEVTLVELVDPTETDYELPAPHTGSLDDAALRQLQQDLIALKRGDILSFGGSQIEVVYDDGSIQAAFDAQFGAGNVQVTSWLG